LHLVHPVRRRCADVPAGVDDESTSGSRKRWLSRRASFYQTLRTACVSLRGRARFADFAFVKSAPLTACATIFNCSRRGGAGYTSTETKERAVVPPILNQFASLPEVVGFCRNLCSPGHEHDRGRLRWRTSCAPGNLLPRVSTSSVAARSWMTCSPGESAVSTSWPTALAWMRSD